MTYADKLNTLKRQYNDAIRALEASYDMESTQTYGWNMTSTFLKRQYSKKYDALIREYEGRKQQMLQSYKLTNPTWARRRRMWEWTFVVGLMVLCLCCTGTLASIDEPATASVSTAMSQTEVTYWTAENIEIPYLKDSTQYVSNPDEVLSQDAVDRMNVTLGRLEHELGVQSVVIVVRHIANDDPFRMAQDVGNHYGVGFDNRGLVVVVGYEDHSINISPGRKLEADLTDAECHRLEKQYVVPAMRAEMPDSGMIYLVDAVYSTLQKKNLPQMSQLTSKDNEQDDKVAAVIMLSFCSLLGWAIFFLRLNRKYQWIGISGVALMSNPFYVEEAVHFGNGFGHGGGFGGSGGGGFSGGSFGGGSFGGGGATSRW